MQGAPCVPGEEHPFLGDTLSSSLPQPGTQLPMAAGKGEKQFFIITLEVNKSPSDVGSAMSLECAEDHGNCCDGSEVVLVSQGLPAEQGFAQPYKAAAPAGWEIEKWASTGGLGGNRRCLSNEGAGGLFLFSGRGRGQELQVD